MYNPKPKVYNLKTKFLTPLQYQKALSQQELKIYKAGSSNQYDSIHQHNQNDTAVDTEANFISVFKYTEVDWAISFPYPTIGDQRDQ